MRMAEKIGARERLPVLVDQLEGAADSETLLAIQRSSSGFHTTSAPPTARLRGDRGVDRGPDDAVHARKVGAAGHPQTRHHARTNRT